MASPRELTVAETAARLGISPSTLHRRMARGEAPPSFLAYGRVRRFPEDKLERWIARQRNGSAK
jgi:excisionase family DNA binding protein